MSRRKSLKSDVSYRPDVLPDALSISNVKALRARLHVHISAEMWLVIFFNMATLTIRSTKKLNDIPGTSDRV